MVRIYTINTEFNSASRLGLTTNLYIDKYANSFDKDVVVRWGNGSAIYMENGQEVDFKNVINPVGSIQLNCQKNEAIKKMAEVIKTPTIFEYAVPKNVLAVYRPKNHSNGKGFSVKKGPFKVNKYYYATQFIRTRKEFRVWFCNGKTLCALRVTSRKIGKYACRSNWTYKFCKTPTALETQALAAAAKIGLETGAADVLLYRKNYIFLELNSAPTIDVKKIEQFFKENIAVLVKNKFPNLV